MMDLDSFLVSLYVLVDDWWRERHPPSVPNKPGRPALLCESEVLTLAILAQWPRFRSERDFWRFASSHLREYFPMLCTQGQLNRRIRALQPELRSLQRDFAEDLAEPSALYRVMDTTLVPAMVRMRASRKGLFCGQASFGRSASKTEWVYGFSRRLLGGTKAAKLGMERLVRELMAMPAEVRVARRGKKVRLKLAHLHPWASAVAKGVAGRFPRDGWRPFWRQS
jgi:hypothetical protein